MKQNYYNSFFKLINLTVNEKKYELESLNSWRHFLSAFFISRHSFVS